MDPNACLARIIRLARENDREEFPHACKDLAEWLSRGGFKPTIPPGMRYIPGTGTDWAILSPAPDGVEVWTLRHYGSRGQTIGSYPLE